MTDLKQRLLDKYPNDALERLVRSNQDYYSTHGDYVPELARLLLFERERLREYEEALRGVSNAYGCFAGCTGALAGAPEDGSGHTPACRAARAALAAGGREA